MSRRFFGAKTVVTLIAAQAFVTAANAQSPEQRSTIEGIRTQLDSIVDAPALATRESLTIERAKLNRDDAMIHIELGYIALRLGQLEGDNDGRYRDAAGEFQWAADLRPDWPHSWYGLGLAELAIGEHSSIAIQNIRQILGIDHLSLSTAAFARAASSDPSFVPALLSLADGVSQQRIKPRRQIAIGALRRAVETSAQSVPDINLALGTLLREVGETDSARVAFHRYLGAGGDSVVGFLEIARTDFVLGRNHAGVDNYYLSASLAQGVDDGGFFRRDIKWIANEEELENFDLAVENGVLENFLRDFWGRRDLTGFQRPGERVAEHYRRFQFAMESYRLLSQHRHHGIIDRYRSGQDEFDDRGIIYLRHGEPDRIASHGGRQPALRPDASVIPGIEPNKSWQYLWPDGPMIFHFVAEGDVQDYKLVESVLDAYGFRPGMLLATGVPVDFVDPELFERRVVMDPRYQHLGGGGTGNLARLASERNQGRRAISIGTTTDTHILRFEKELEPFVLRYSLTQGNGLDGTVLIVFALPTENLKGTRVEQGVRYPIEIRVTAEDVGGREAGRVDTTRVFEAPVSLSDGEFLLGLEEIELASGLYTIRIAFRDLNGGAGGLVKIDSVVVPPPEKDPMVGTLVTGLRDGGLAWVSRGDSVHINPTGIYPSDAEVMVHYELFNIPVGEVFQSKLEVKRKRGLIGGIFGGRGDRISLEFTGVSEGRETMVDHKLDLATLRPGDYEIKLEVELQDGSIQQRISRMTVVAPGQ